MGFRQLLIRFIAIFLLSASVGTADTASVSPAVKRAIEREMIERERDFRKVLELRSRELRLHTGDLAEGASELRQMKQERAAKAESARLEYFKTRRVYSSEIAEAKEAEDLKRKLLEDEQQELTRARFVAHRDAVQKMKAALPDVDPYLELRIPVWIEPDFKSSHASPNGFKPSTESKR